MAIARPPPKAAQTRSTYGTMRLQSHGQDAKAHRPTSNPSVWSDQSDDLFREKHTSRKSEDDSNPNPFRGVNDGKRRDQTRQQAFPRISKPVELLQVSYDCVVIGSGYGGGVAASRMARAGQSVCLLERGEERWPGEYPDSAQDAAAQFHCSGDYAPGPLPRTTVNSGPRTGMYHLMFGRGQSALVCNGLGGTSLINANVFLEADDGALAMEHWPPQIRENPGCLAPYYQKVRDVLEPEPYPDDWPEPKKVQMLRRQAGALGMSDRFYKVPQTTRFRPGPNSCGVQMSASTLTGQDAMGLNDGSKTTTLVTYLADAWNWGADMFCQCEVRHIEKALDGRGGYLVYFAWHGHNRGRFPDNLYADLMCVHARKAVFLGAGAMGTTEILLRSKSRGLAMSDRVGQGMSGNGDMLAFGYKTDDEVNAIGNQTPCPSNPVGPTINAVIDGRGRHQNPLHDFVIEEGTIPQALSGVLRSMLKLMPSSQPPPAKTLLQRARAAIARWNSRLLGPFRRPGALERSQVFLIMSHDGSQATLRLDDDRPVLEFVGVGRGDRTKALNALLAKATEAVGGTLKSNPFCTLMGGQQQVTVHPLGGAAMARDNTGATGVTNHLGEVFAGNDTSETHPGLIVTDGAVVPAALGANPFATIAALAERAVAAFARTHQLVVSDAPNGVLDLGSPPAHAGDAGADALRGPPTGGLDFTELMTGFVHGRPATHGGGGDEPAAFELAARAGRSRGEAARLFVSVAAADTARFNRGILTGSFVCPTLAGSPFMVLRGDLSLFQPDHTAPETRRLTYDLDMTGVDGRRLHLHGYKVVDSSVTLNPCQLWRATTTLYVRITNVGKPGHGGGSLVARGILRIRLRDLRSQVLSLAPPPGRHLLARARQVAAFVSYFACSALPFVLTPLAPLQYPDTPGWTSSHGFVNPTPPTRSLAVEASDGVHSNLYVWEPCPGGVATDEHGRPVETRNVLMIPGAAVDYGIFALPTIPFNAVNYLTRAGYRVFVTVHRICRPETARSLWTTYDARLDIRACLQLIRQAYGDGDGDGNDDDDKEATSRQRKIYTIAHCLGSVAFASGLLDGTIPADWILGITCSQVFMNPVWSALNGLKAAAPLRLDRLYTKLLGDWFDCGTTADDSLVQRVINQLLRFYPQASREMCRSAVCHRTTLLFGRCWSHQNLNEATHRHIDRFFSGANMTMFNLLVRMGRAGEVSGNAPDYTPLVTRPNMERLRGIPMLLFSGSENVVLSPAATETTYESLCDMFGLSAGAGAGGLQYRRRVVPGYGHLDCWMGRNAWRDVFPFVREEVDRVVRGEAYRFRQPDDRFKSFMEAEGGNTG